ncbi:MAG: hypothetical protein K8I82_22535 [Anaerolineae bacterium]|jgi:hypothetical protein|nr:hypothetical protein [Anaerolineae bacterium]
MESLGYWCVSSCLFVLGGVLLVFALLRYSGSKRYKNRRYAELMWQAQHRDTDWWLDL